MANCQMPAQEGAERTFACKTSELSQVTGVKKHILRRYARIGLLNRERADTNLETSNTDQHFFTHDDLIRLERVAFMQMIGLSRSEIKDVLRSQRRTMSGDLRLQYELLNEKRKRIDRLIYFLQFAEEVNRRDGSDWHHLGKVVESIKYAEDRRSLKKRYMQNAKL